MSDQSTSTANEPTHTAGAFDIRTLIAALIGIFGLILTIVGLVDNSPADLEKPDGFNVNLWAGLGMLVVAALMQAWAWWRPVIVPDHPDSAAADD